jgi:hypothetical protein
VKAVVTRPDQILGTADGFRDHHGQPAGHGFVHHETPFFVEAWQDEAVGKRVEGGVFLDLAEAGEVDGGFAAFLVLGSWFLVLRSWLMGWLLPDL